MDKVEHQKVHIEKAIERARDGVSERIDELDRHLRSSLDMKALAADHAPQIVAAGALAGFLVGFGFPKMLRRAVAIGLPLTIAAMKLRKKSQSSG